MAGLLGPVCKQIDAIITDTSTVKKVYKKCWGPANLLCYNVLCCIVYNEVPTNYMNTLLYPKLIDLQH